LCIPTHLPGELGMIALLINDRTSGKVKTISEVQQMVSVINANQQKK
jgi:hypothetical protein